MTNNKTNILDSIKNWNDFNSIVCDIMRTQKKYDCSYCTQGNGVIYGHKELHCIDHAKKGKCVFYNRYKDDIDKAIKEH